jgi:lysophospholipase L1-like esterase
VKRLVFAMLGVFFLRDTAALAEPACPVPEEWTLGEMPLRATKTALAAHQPLKIVALGSGPTQGAAAGDPELTYPARLQTHLAAALPGIQIDVVNRGVAHQTTAQMMNRIDKDVLAEHPALVIWEAGTVDASRGLQTEDFADAMQDGLEKLRAAHVDVILMDMQYAPSTVSIIDFTPYIDVLRRVAGIAEVPVFDRFEIMHAWSEEGLFVYDETSPGDRTKTVRRVYDCLAAGLADDIARSLK